MKRNKLMLIVVLIMIGMLFSLWAMPAKGVPILEYHMVNDEDPDNYVVSKAEFAQQMQFLQAKGYHAISLAEMMDGFSGKTALPDKPIVLTFDDGYADNYSNALPIMQQYGMKGTVFMIAGMVGEPDFLDWSQLQELKKENTEIGSHTVNHTDLKAADAQLRETELLQSKLVLEEKLGGNVEFIAYPYGQYDENIFTVLEKAGYRGALTGKAGLNTGKEHPYCLKRVNIPKPRLGLFEFRLRLLRAELYGALHI